MIGILAIAFTFGIIIFLHELGHFLSAKKLGVKVENFSFGFGPEIVGKTVGDTRYSIRILPLGGAVKMAGEFHEDSKGEPNEFLSKPWYQRIMIVASGPLMNYVLAIFFFFITIYFWGMQAPTNKPIIGEVREGMPAEKAGMKAGDVITAIGNQKVTLWQEAAEIIHKDANKKVTVDIERDKKPMKLEITPELDKNLNVGLIGIFPEVETVKVGMFRSMGLSLRNTFELNVVFLQYIGEKIIKLEKPEVAGPIGIAQIVAKTARFGFGSLLALIANISVMIGLMNLFPIPLFDGGHIFFFLIEGVITHKPTNRRVLETANYIGLSIILALVVFAFYSDFQRIGLFTFVQKFLKL